MRRRAAGNIALATVAAAAAGLAALRSVPSTPLSREHRSTHCSTRRIAHCEASSSSSSPTISLSLTPDELTSILWRYTFKREAENGLAALLGAGLVAADVLLLTMTGLVGGTVAVGAFSLYVYAHLERVELPLLLPLEKIDGDGNEVDEDAATASRSAALLRALRRRASAWWANGGSAESSRIRFMDVDREMVTLMGLLEAHNTTSKLELVAASDPRAALVRRVGSRIAASTSLTLPAGQAWAWSVYVDGTPNAFVLPGGKAFVSTGLLTLLRRPDELATVLAHEVAHVQARHAAGTYVLVPVTPVYIGCLHQTTNIC